MCVCVYVCVCVCACIFLFFYSLINSIVAASGYCGIESPLPYNIRNLKLGLFKVA